MINIFSGKGRATRKEYWIIKLPVIIISILVNIISKGKLTIIDVALFLATIGIDIQRMHDVGKSAWFILVPVYHFILTLTPGEKGPNKYGNDPRDEYYCDEIDAKDRVIENKWICGHCKAVNDIFIPTCKMCGKELENNNK